MLRGGEEGEEEGEGCKEGEGYKEGCKEGEETQVRFYTLVTVMGIPTSYYFQFFVS